MRMKSVAEIVNDTSKGFLDNRIWPGGSLVRWWRADKHNNQCITATNELRSDDEILAKTDADL